jgi:hypothetical protein
MSTLLRLKKEVEDEKDSDIKMTFVGAQEAHLLAAGELSCVSEAFALTLRCRDCRERCRRHYDPVPSFPR